MNQAEFIGCITCSSPSVHPRSKEQEFLGHFLTLHFAAMLAGPSMYHLWNGSVGVYGNTQQRDSSPIDCILAWQPYTGLPCCWCHEYSHFLAAGSRGTEMSIFITNEWQITFPGCTLQCWAQQQQDSFPLWVKNAKFNCLAGSRTLMLLKDFFFPLFFLSIIVRNSFSNRYESKGMDSQLVELSQLTQ